MAIGASTTVAVTTAVMVAVEHGDWKVVMTGIIKKAIYL